MVQHGVAGTLPAPSASSGERLRSYATWCNAVEGNTTFYATPTRSTVESWARQTAPGFRFVAKLPKSITHDRRLTGVDEELRSFLEAIEPLGPRAHALWIQLRRRSARPTSAPWRAFSTGSPARTGTPSKSATARSSTTRDPSGCSKAFSRSDAEWIPFDTDTLFRSPPTSDAERDAWAKKPRVPRRAFALTDRPIVRYLGRDDTARTVEGWQPWIGTVAGWLREGRSPTVFIHTPDNADAPMLARRFHDDVRALLPGIEPLPEPVPVEPLTLF
ncbi:DUF72 domain-containing protein [Streptosporangium lutulentum]